MKQTNGGFGPSYNVQFVTEAINGFVVGVSVGNDNNDQHQLVDSIAAAQAATGQAPNTVIADGGYANRENVEAMTAQQPECELAFCSPAFQLAHSPSVGRSAAAEAESEVRKLGFFTAPDVRGSLGHGVAALLHDLGRASSSGRSGLSN